MIESFLPSSILSFYAEIASVGVVSLILGCRHPKPQEPSTKKWWRRTDRKKNLNWHNTFRGKKQKDSGANLPPPCLPLPVPFLSSLLRLWGNEPKGLDGRTHFHAERIVRTLSTMDEKGCSSHFLPFLNGIQARLWCLCQPSIFISFQSHCIVCSLLKPALTYAKFHRFTRYIHETYGEKNARAYTEAVIHYQTKLRQSFELQPAGTYKI